VGHRPEPRESIWRRIPASSRWPSAPEGTASPWGNSPGSGEPATEPDPSPRLALDTTVELPVVTTPRPPDSPGTRGSTSRKWVALAVAMVLAAAVAAVAATLGLSPAGRQGAGTAVWVPANATTPPSRNTPPPTPTGSAPVTYEAEAASNTLTGSAFV